MQTKAFRTSNLPSNGKATQNLLKTFKPPLIFKGLKGPLPINVTQGQGIARSLLVGGLESILDRGACENEALTDWKTGFMDT